MQWPFEICFGLPYICASSLNLLGIISDNVFNSFDAALILNSLPGFVLHAFTDLGTRADVAANVGYLARLQQDDCNRTQLPVEGNAQHDTNILPDDVFGFNNWRGKIFPKASRTSLPSDESTQIAPLTVCSVQGSQLASLKMLQKKERT
jgi:hypothetical protein